MGAILLVIGSILMAAILIIGGEQKIGKPLRKPPPIKKNRKKFEKAFPTEFNRSAQFDEVYNDKSFYGDRSSIYAEKSVDYENLKREINQLRLTIIITALLLAIIIFYSSS